MIPILQAFMQKTRCINLKNIKLTFQTGRRCTFATEAVEGHVSAAPLTLDGGVYGLGGFGV